MYHTPAMVHPLRRKAIECTGGVVKKFYGLIMDFEEQHQKLRKIVVIQHVVVKQKLDKSELFAQVTLPNGLFDQKTCIVLI